MMAHPYSEKQNNMAMSTQQQTSYGNEQTTPSAPPPYSAVDYSKPPPAVTAATQQAPTFQQSSPHPYYNPYPGVQGPAQAVVHQPQMMMVQPPIITNNAIVQTVTTVPLGKSSAIVTCPVCHSNANTRTSRKLKPDAWICCILLCVFGCELCIWIPFVMESNYITEHRCGKCNSFLGSSN